MRRAFLAAVAMAATLPGHVGAASAGADVRGYWQGRIGDKPVVACLSARGGQYFEAGRDTPIDLQADASGGFLEEPFAARQPRGAWSGLARKGDVLTGRWSKADASPPAKLRLHRTATSPDDRLYCAFDVDAAALAGVWAGTLGDQAVVACVQPDGEGRYFYLAHANSPAILLQAEPDADWVERDWPNAATGRWRDVHADGDRLIARWTSPDGTRLLPVALTRSAAGDEAMDCQFNAPEAFYAPRRAALKIDTGPVTSQHGVALRKLALAGAQVSVLQLERPDAAGERINATLRERFETALATHYQCHEYNWTHADLRHADARWLVVDTAEYAECGGAHPSYGDGAITFDRRTGDEVPTASWVGQHHQLPDGLWERIARKLIGSDGNWEHDPQGMCAQQWADTHYATVWPTAGGLAFLPQFSHALTVCEEEAVLPTREVAPYLTEAGREALRDP